MTTNYHITKNALEVRVPGTTDIDDCGTMDFHFDLHLSKLGLLKMGQWSIFDLMSDKNGKGDKDKQSLEAQGLTPSRLKMNN